MASTSRTVRVRFDGDSAGLTAASARARAALEGMQKNARDAQAGFQSFVTKAAMFAPAVGAILGATAGLTGVLGVLPGLALAGGLAMGALKIGTAGFGDAIKSMGDPAKFAEAIGKLSPNARAAALAVQSLKPQLDGLKASVQNKLFEGLATEIKQVGAALLPTMNAQLTATAGLFNATALSFTGWLKMPSTVTDINTALTGARGFLAGVLSAAKPLAQVFLDLGVVAAPYVARLGQIIGNAAVKLQEFVSNARGTGQLQGWVQQGVDVFSRLWNVIKMVGEAVWNIAVAFGSSGLPSVLEVVAGALLKVSQFIRDNAAVMVPLITVIGLLVAAFKGVMMVVGIIEAIKGATVLWTAAQWLLNAALWANPITWVVLAIVALIAIIVLLVVHWDTVKQKATEVVAWLLMKWTECKVWLQGIWESLKAAALAVFNAIVVWITQKITQVLSVIAWLQALPGRVGAWFSDMAQRAIAKAAELVGWLRGLPGRILSAIGSLGSILVSAGRDLLNGLWRGIQGGWSWLMGAVRNLASSLLNAAKSALGIASPSKLFRDEVGRWVPEGMAVGITANTAGVKDAARSLADTAISASTPTVSASERAAALSRGAVSAADGLNGTGQGQTPVQVVVMIDGQEFKGMIRTEISEENRALRRAVGV